MIIKLYALLTLAALLVGCGALSAVDEGQAPTVATATTQPAAPAPTARPAPPESAPPPLAAAILPFAGLLAGLDGKVVAPGYSHAPEVFQSFIALRVDIRDPAAPAGDDGIEAVTFQVTRENADGSSTFVYGKVETTAPYCLFGGDDPACNPIQLVSGATWPDGNKIAPGNYRVQIDVTADNRAKGATWNALFSVAPYPAAARGARGG